MVAPKSLESQAETFVAPVVSVERNRPANQNRSRSASDDSRYVLVMRELRHQLVNRKSKNSKGEYDSYLVEFDELLIPRGQFVAIQGPSGCGKTTLMTLIGLACEPKRHTDNRPAIRDFQLIEEVVGDSEGRTQSIGGQRKQPVTKPHNIASLWKSGHGQINGLRRRMLGFCLQRGELLENLTVLDNVMMPAMLNGYTFAQARQSAEEALQLLSGGFHGTASGNQSAGNELLDRKQQLPYLLSGGQYQRVALARALAHKPQILLLDEPTGNLDPHKAEEVLKDLDRIRRETGLTVIMITHDNKLAKRFAQRIVRMGATGDARGGIVEFKRRVRIRGQRRFEWVQTDSHWKVLPEKVPGEPRSKLTSLAAESVSHADVIKDSNESHGRDNNPGNDSPR